MLFICIVYTCRHERLPWNQQLKSLKPYALIAAIFLYQIPDVFFAGYAASQPAAYSLSRMTEGQWIPMRIKQAMLIIRMPVMNKEIIILAGSPGFIRIQRQIGDASPHRNTVMHHYRMRQLHRLLNYSGELSWTRMLAQLKCAAVRSFPDRSAPSGGKQKRTELPPEQTPQQQIPTYSSNHALFFFIFLSPARGASCPL